MVFRSKDRWSKRQPGTRADVAGTLGESAGSLDEIVAATDRAVAELQAAVDAHGEAEEARPGVLDRAALERELARTLLERAEGLRREAKELSGILGRASTRLAKPSDAGPTAARSTPFARRSPRKRDAKATQDAAAGVAGWNPPAGQGRGAGAATGVRLLATQMAVAGSSPDEIADRLRAEFGVDDAKAVVSDVLSTTNQEA